MPIVQAAIVRAVSVLGDSLGISTLAAGVQTSARLAYVRTAGRSSANCETAIAALLVNLIPLASGDDSDQDRSMQLKQNVSFWHKSARRNSCRGLLMDGFLRGMQ
jgi:hypothetical protein